MGADASEATECGEKRFVSRVVVEEVAEVVGGIYTNGAVFEIGQIKRSIQRQSCNLAIEEGNTYVAWPLIQGSS